MVVLGKPEPGAAALTALPRSGPFPPPFAGHFTALKKYPNASRWQPARSKLLISPYVEHGRYWPWARWPGKRHLRPVSNGGRDGGGACALVPGF